MGHPMAVAMCGSGLENLPVWMLAEVGAAVVTISPAIATYEQLSLELEEKKWDRAILGGERNYACNEYYEHGRWFLNEKFPERKAELQKCAAKEWKERRKSQQISQESITGFSQRRTRYFPSQKENVERNREQSRWKSQQRLVNLAIKEQAHCSTFLCQTRGKRRPGAGRLRCGRNGGFVALGDLEGYY